MSKPLQIFCAAFILFGLGSGFGTCLHRASRLPAWFWLPCVSGAACLAAYALFFVFVFSSDAGRIAALVAWSVSVGLFALSWRDARVRQTLRQRDVWLPVLLTAVLTASYLASVLASDLIVNDRFRFPLPGDNYMPRVMAEWLASGSYTTRGAPKMLVGDWHMSDRPPLQASLVLAALPLQVGDFFSFYQFVATTCQMGWLAAVYALARTIALPRRYLQFTLAAAASSPFFFFNSVYTWPKLLGTWLFITALALVLQFLRDRKREEQGLVQQDEGDERKGASAWVLVMAGVAIALSLLSHGGVGFSVLALPLLAVYWKPWRAVRVRPIVILVAGAVVPVLYAPWSVYQKVVDPPGNRLLKQHFAGVDGIDARGTWEAIVDTYRALDAGTYVAGRWSNVRQQWFGTPDFAVDHWIDWVQWQQLMRHVPLIGFLCVGYIMLVWTPARADLPDAVLQDIRQLTWYALATAAIWIVVMIVPSSAMVHQGSYSMTLLLLLSAAVLTAMLPPPARWTIMVLHVALFATCYLLSTRTASPTAVVFRLGTLVQAAVLFAGFLVMLGAIPDAPTEGERR
jgi:hypothetical protein